MEWNYPTLLHEMRQQNNSIQAIVTNTFQIENKSLQMFEDKTQIIRNIDDKVWGQNRRQITVITCYKTVDNLDSVNISRHSSKLLTNVYILRRDKMQ